MKNKLAALMIVLLATAAAASLHPAIAQDNSSTNPADVGSRVRSMVELGSVYSNIYDIAITVLETVRGEEAMKRLKAASPDNPAPAEGFEYILARIKFELKGRSVSDNLTLVFSWFFSFRNWLLKSFSNQYLFYFTSRDRKLLTFQ